jgi:hypothetical protein
MVCSYTEASIAVDARHVVGALSCQEATMQNEITKIQRVFGSGRCRVEATPADPYADAEHLPHVQLDNALALVASERRTDEFGWNSVFGSGWCRYEAWVGPRHEVVAVVDVGHVPNSHRIEVAMRLLAWELCELLVPQS